MNWIKDAYIDILVLVAILIFSFFYTHNVLLIVLWVYTGLLLAGRILALFMDGLQRRADKSSAPDVFYHVIYALSTGVLIYVEMYYLAGAWALIWILSAWSQRKKDN